jgi:hypothetical protein
MIKHNLKNQQWQKFKYGRSIKRNIYIGGWNLATKFSFLINTSFINEIYKAVLVFLK